MLLTNAYNAQVVLVNEHKWLKDISRRLGLDVLAAQTQDGSITCLRGNNKSIHGSNNSEKY
jgi:hypothetical protein